MPEAAGEKSRDNAEVQSAYEYVDVVRPPRLRAGDHVRVVAPTGTPDRAEVERTAQWLKNQGLEVSVGTHALDAVDDGERVQDIDRALRDLTIKAIVAVGTGAEAHRIADDLDFATAAHLPTLLVGFRECTILHLAFWERAGLAGIYGVPDQSFVAAAFGTEPVVVRSVPDSHTAELTTSGRATGVLLGGDQEQIATAAGWVLPSLHGAILLLEAYGLRPDQIDRQLTMLHRTGRLKGVRAVAVGRYLECGPGNVLDVLRDRLAPLGVPILGGLPIGQGAIPVGTPAMLDADAGTLTIEPAVS
ncbi:muramoyltetrapeptide carboxypeptidase [Paractinoplanes brasiliensis]|uniref:Muramoyltetrapeptide carboxypeptidase n=1 Tax=Paractinoplanes brasiliensis TaxID=52695 RepID=A0A4R6JWU8_9ACTN|nr:muramoyltetrapeptide carboxypeptidase [Actinoplanes brasiliensis]GID26250.1 muramoyltetrapeptide carboxypeptidase [Actinoplanes brasiliensis]